MVQKYRDKKTPCCGNGTVDTEVMRAGYNELQNPPEVHKFLFKTNGPNCLGQFETFYKCPFKI